MNNKKKIAVIGLDGATFDLIRPWAEDGSLPAFKKLLERSAWGKLKSTIPDITIPAWPSFSTGCNPGKHGFYGFAKEKPGSYTLTTETRPSWKIKPPTLWEIISENNGKVGVINVPSTYPAKKVNGHVITGMLTPHFANFTYPAEFQSEIKNKVGGYNVSYSAMSAKYPDTILSDTQKALNQRVNVFEYLWKDKVPDFLMMVDNGTDRAGHMFWKFLDPLNPLYNEKETLKFGNPLKEYYMSVDKALERIISIIGEDTVLILMSDHGMGPNRKIVNLNMLLIETGFMKLKNDLLNKAAYYLFRKGLTPNNLHNILRSLGVERLIGDNISEKNKFSIINKLFFSDSGIDWDRTKAFASGPMNSLTINVKSRQPSGTVMPGPEYEKVRDDLIHELSNFKDPETDVPVVKSIYKREEIYSGKYLEKAPDVVVMPHDYYSFYGMHGFSTHKIISNTFMHSGFHRPEGIFLIAGKGIKKNKEIKEANIIDVCPTILNLMQIPVPSHIDGKVLTDIMDF